MMGHLIICVGLARAGKSTYTKTWLENSLKKGEKAIVANADSLRLTISGQRYLRSVESIVHATNYYLIKDFYHNGYTVLIDETNTTIGSINKWLEIDPQAEFVYFDTSVEECERRAIESGQSDLVEKNVIKRQWSNLTNLVGDYYPESDDVIEITGSVIMRTLQEIRRLFNESTK